MQISNCRLLKLNEENSRLAEQINSKMFMCLVEVISLWGFFLCAHHVRYLVMINRLYTTNSTLLSPVKMEYGSNFSISGLKMMMNSGLGKIFLKFLYAGIFSFHTSSMGRCFRETSNSVLQKSFSNFSCMFLNPNNFFQFEF